jgi:7-cyano-7-deazaguanine synthase
MSIGTIVKLGMSKKLVLAFSGGMDSSVLLHLAIRNGYKEIYTLSFDYGQRHKRELECVKQQLEELRGLYSNVMTYRKVIDVSYIKDIAPVSSLTNNDIATPNIKDIAGEAQPKSYVPYRNMMFLSIACSYAEANGIDKVWYGAAQADSLAGYWDGDTNFVNSMNVVVGLNRQHKISIEAPLLDKSKADIVKIGVEMGVNFANTWTCYSQRDDGLADAETPSSALRLKGFIDAKYKDPIKYLQQKEIDKVYKKNKCKEIAP